MRIHELTFSNLRGVRNFAMREIPDTGVVVISGENEAGKTTVTEAIWTVLFEKHSAGGKKFKAKQPVGEDVPISITLEATVGPIRFRIFKQFVRKTKSELKILSPSRKTYTAGEADIQLERIIDEHVDRSLLETLFVRQGKATAAFAAAGIPALTQALENSDNPTDGKIEEDSGLLAAVAQEYARYFTAKGQPREELKAALADVDHATARLSAAAETKKSLEADVAAYLRDEDALRDATQKIPEASSEVAERKETFAQAEQAEQAVNVALAALEHAQVRAAAGAKELAARKTQLTEIADATDELEKLTARKDELANEVAEQQTAISAARQQVSSAEEAHAAARTAATENRAEIAQETARIRAQELAEFLNEVETQDKAIAAARQALPNPLLGDSHLKTAEAISTKIAVAQARLEATATKLRLSAAHPTEITLNGRTVQLGAGQREELLHEETSLVIGDVTATFVPDESQDNLVSDLQELQRKLGEFLANCGVETLDELHTQATAHATQLADIEKMETQRAAIVGSKDLRSIAQQLADAKRELPEKLEDGRSLDELQEEEKQLAQREEDARIAAEAARRDLEKLQNTGSRMQLAEIGALVTSAQTRLSHLKNAADQAESKQSMTALETEVHSLSKEEISCQEHLDAVRVKTAGLDINEAKELLEGAESRLASLHQTVADTRERMAARKVRFDIAEGAAEEFINAEAHLKAVQQRLDGVQRRADAVKLLQETLLKHLDAARRRYSAPFVAKLNALAHSVFGPDLDFVLDEQLQISQRIIDDRPVAVDALSGGAQEQLALLARCAVADLIDEKDGVPVFLDDTLGNTDKQRLIMMNRVLSHLGKRHQVFVLTSMPERFERIAGKVAWTMDELKQAGESGS
ncbi:AAA family ATPase [Staphylococcus chromogenes]|nr:AAA family ATPase [Staphylococcus chromogenes]